MRKILFLMVMAVAVVASAQSLTKRKALKTYAMGTLRLEQVISKNDTAYALYIDSNNRYEGYFPVALGDKENAIRLLKVLEETKLEDDDLLYLENQTNNRVGRGLFGSLRIYSETGVFSRDFDRKYMRKCREVIEGGGADEEEMTQSEKVRQRKKNMHSAQE